MGVRRLLGVDSAETWVGVEYTERLYSLVYVPERSSSTLAGDEVLADGAGDFGGGAEGGQGAVEVGGEGEGGRGEGLRVEDLFSWEEGGWDGICCGHCWWWLS